MGKKEGFIFRIVGISVENSVQNIQMTKDEKKMNKPSKDQIRAISELLKEGKPIPEEYRWFLFENKQETELNYEGKRREVDILAETMAVPLQKEKVFRNIIEDKWYNMLIFGDNLQILKTLIKWKEEGRLKNSNGSKGVRLIYIDPPFGTGDIYGKGNVGAYSAKLMGTKYLEWLRQRIILLKELLSDDGSFYMRIDYHFGHYMKILLDEIFGKGNFRNEIVINRFKKKSDTFTTVTESIYFYTKTGNFSFNKISRPRICTFCKQPIKAKWHTMSSPGEGKPSIILGEKMYPPKGRHWTYNQENIHKMEQEGRIQINKNLSYTDTQGRKVKGMPEYKESEEQICDSNWTDIFGYKFGAEYPTENSEELLERIIRAGTDGESDIVLDAFAGSGTTGAVAEKLKRRWIMIDSSKYSLYTMIKRLLNLREKIGNKGKHLKHKSFAHYNAGLYDMKMLKELPFIEYRKFALELFQCRDEIHNLAGIELDGYLGYDHVLVFKWKNNGKVKTEYVMDRGFIDNIHSILRDKIRKKFFIIAPAASVVFLEDYIEKDGIKYYILRIPYSVIDELHKKNFKLLEQPISADISEVNKVMEQIGFDFIYPPDVECKCYIDNPKDKLFKEAVIKIKKFRSNVISKKPIPEVELSFKALSMVMIDYNFNGDYFNMDDKWFASDLEKNEYEIRFPVERLKDQIMIVYMDVYGNEKKEILTVKNFKSGK